MARSSGAAALAAVAVAVMIAGCGSSKQPGAAAPARPAARVTLDLKAGAANTVRVACGIKHHYTVYRAARVSYGGTVAPAPSGRWDVKVKVKMCRAGRFVKVSSDHVAGGARGRFGGEVTAPGPGSFFARASYEQGGRETKSDKEYFLIRR